MFDFFSHRSSASRQGIFQIPKLDPFENPLVEIHPAQLRQWATALPFANPDQLSEAVLTSLGRLNRYPGPVKKRNELMEIYQTPALRLCHSSGARRGSTTTSQLRRVMLEMAYGYSHIANECLAGKANRKSLDRLAHALYHSLKFYLLEYLYACEEFDCRSGHTYREISRLRTYAEEQELHNREIEDSEDPQSRQATITHQFNRYLLLRLLDPCHLQEGETRICYEYLESIAGSARFRPPTSSHTEASGHYVIDRLGEVPPYPYDPESEEKLAVPRFVLFDLNPVSQQIHQQMRKLERAEDQKPVAMLRLSQQEAGNLLARMLKSWHIRTKRDSERHTTSGQVQVWTGLQKIHGYLTRDRWDTEAENDEITMTQGPSLPPAKQDPGKPQLVARRFNQSRSGVALHLPFAHAAAPSIGELILISLAGVSDPNDWKIGVVKRALNHTDGILEIGIQFMLGRIVPVTLRSMTLHGENDEPPRDHPGLYLDLGHSHRSSLIVPKRFFAIGQEYRVEEMTPAPGITPLMLLESTAMFERYRVKGIS